jgi:hypothetical protein
VVVADGGFAGGVTAGFVGGGGVTAGAAAVCVGPFRFVSHNDHADPSGMVISSTSSQIAVEMERRRSSKRSKIR